jgi:MFS family permease
MHESVPSLTPHACLSVEVLDKQMNSQKTFYAWIVVAACFATTLTLGEAMWAFGVFFKPLEKEFGWSRALISSGYTAFLIGFGISAATTGRLVDKYSPRPILFVSGFLAGLGTFLCSQVNTIFQLRAFLLFGGLGGGATFSVPTTTVQRYFYHRSRGGLALGIVVAGVGVGGLIFAPLINYLILNYGWRKAYMIIGALFFIVIAISSLAIRQSPVETSTVSGREINMLNPLSAKDWAIGKIISTPSFAGITFTHCAVVITFQTICVHLVPHAIDVGVSPTASALALGLMGGCSVPGRIISGFIADRTKWQRILALSLFGMALLSLPWLLFLKETWMLYWFVVLYGICHGGRIASHLGILGEFFGMRSLGELIGITTAMGMFFGAFAPYIAGFIFDITGSYFWIFMITIGILFSSGIIASVMKKPLAPA